MVRSTGMKGYSSLMKDLGVDPLPLLYKHGLPEDLGEVDDALVPLIPVMQLMEDSASASQHFDLGLRLAAQQDIDIVGPLALAIRHSANVYEAMYTSSQYMYVHSTAIHLGLVEPSPLIPDSVEVRIEIGVPNAPMFRQTIDQCLGRMHHMLKSFAKENYQLLAITFPYEGKPDYGAYQRFFGRAVIYPEHEYIGLHVSPKTLSSKIDNINPALKRIALEYLQMHYGNPELSMVSRVRRALHCTIGTSGGSKSSIAELLFLHPRTMQRKLAEENATFDLIRDEVRQEIAFRFLTQTRMPLSQLAPLLGFADQSVLTVSSRRWFGMPPSKVRAMNSATNG
ncbi:helix-turn-helix domain-containing protein [Serratia sp. YC16]|nr:AraC family transcriptional regulator [Serratia surfactantfaciens]MTD05414.1 helix-turn-helix domain-containing protein [Serratia sp. YC16]